MVTQLVACSSCMVHVLNQLVIMTTIISLLYYFIIMHFLYIIIHCTGI